MKRLTWAEWEAIPANYKTRTSGEEGAILERDPETGATVLVPVSIARRPRTGARKRRTMRQALQLVVDEQRKWIESRGGNEAGYVEFYGSQDDPDRFGDGGEAIYAADLGALRRYEAELEAHK